ncbi:uncharacterized protein LOC135502550 [Lineus longissimus]|uniref:uncharacterized protein LOC135502550 n=1 Tax=Lineus longissimus TaxID=88925 RepID=UPI00315C9DB3
MTGFGIARVGDSLNISVLGIVGIGLLLVGLIIMTIGAILVCEDRKNQRREAERKRKSKRAGRKIYLPRLVRADRTGDAASSQESSNWPEGRPARTQDELVTARPTTRKHTDVSEDLPDGYTGNPEPVAYYNEVDAESG